MMRTRCPVAIATRSGAEWTAARVSALTRYFLRMGMDCTTRPVAAFCRYIFPGSTTTITSDFLVLDIAAASSVVLPFPAGHAVNIFGIPRVAGHPRSEEHTSEL